MSDSRKCGQCQRDIPPHAPFGMCPVCVLNVASDEEPSSAGSNQASTAEAPVAQPHELTGKFPNLEIVSLIGRGGMGAVYRARQTTLDRIVALKILSRSLAEDPSFTERFNREAKTLAKLTHPNIVTVFDSGNSADGSYLVMEFVDGVNLRDAIESRTIDPSRALAIVQQICDALQHAHDAGIIHRDIKPENILIDRNGMVKIADFGLAKLLQPEPEQYSLTGTRQVLGTRNYMAPEQIETPDSVDHRADLYSLGVVLYELLTGELPIGRFAPPSSRSQCSKQLDDLVMRTLEKDPSHRFQQASMIGSAVRELESSISHSAGKPPIVESVTRAEFVSANGGLETQPLTDPLPFWMSNVKSEPEFPVAGKITMYIAKAQGLLHAYEDRIELEYEVQDPMGMNDSKLMTRSVPLSNLAAVEYQPAWWGGAKIRFRAMSLSAIEEIPKSKQGAFHVNVANRDRKAADQFADTVNRKIVSQHPHRSGAQRALNNEQNRAVTIEDIVQLDERLKVPRIAFLACSIITLVVGILLTLLTAISFSNPKVDHVLMDLLDVVAPHMIYFFGPFFLVSWVLPLVIAKSLQHHRNYHLLIVLLIAMILPWLSPLLFLPLPFAVWTLVVLCLPNTKRVFRSAALNHRLSQGKSQKQTTRFFGVPVLAAMVALFVCVPLGFGAFILMSAIGYQQEQRWAEARYQEIALDNTMAIKSAFEEANAQESIVIDPSFPGSSVDAFAVPPGDAGAQQDGWVPTHDNRLRYGPSGGFSLSVGVLMVIGVVMVVAGLLLGCIISILINRMLKARRARL